jgi:hypothetical protein
MIERTVTVAVDLTPQELAFSFCNMGDGNQADFFSEVGVLTSKWKKPFCFQLQYIVDHERLTDEGRRVMESIGEYGQNRILEAAPALLEALEELMELESRGRFMPIGKEWDKARAAIKLARGE